MRVTGAKEIDDVLRGLPLYVSDKLLQNSFSDAAKPLVEKAKLIAPEGPTGNLVDSIGIRKERSAKSLLARSVGEIQVGPQRRGKYKGYAGHLVEYGTANRETKSGADRGKMHPNPFMAPAFEQTKNIVEARINDSIGKKVTAFIRKRIKNAR